jgi:hypothetical protein
MALLICLKKTNFPPAHTAFDGPNTEIPLPETWVQKPLGHGYFFIFFILTFVHVFGALDRSTSQRVSSKVFLFLIKWGIISYQITTDTLEDMITICEKYCIYFEVGNLTGLFC